MNERMNEYLSTRCGCFCSSSINEQGWFIELVYHNANAVTEESGDLPSRPSCPIYRLCDLTQAWEAGTMTSSSLCPEHLA